MSVPILRGTKRDDDLRGQSTLSEWLHGGRGDDRLFSGAGRDTLAGGQGNDTLTGFVDANLLRGGLGDDVLDGGSGGDTLNGGEGNDHFFDARGANVMFGGRGDDIFESLGNQGAAAGRDTVRGGAGSDTFKLAVSSTVAGAVADLIEDFQTGGGGDVIDLNIVFSFAFIGRDLFAEGKVRLVQAGADTLVEVQNAANAYQTVLILAGIDAADLTSENFHANFGIGLDPARHAIGHADPLPPPPDTVWL